jgi:hypothetical protein
MRISF